MLAVAAVSSVDGAALPPAVGLAAALAVLGVFDALAGVIAVVVFVAGVVLLGGVTSADAARTLLGLATLWFAAPLIAGTARPLRRPPTMTRQEHWDRTADIVIASLVGAWAVQVILQGLPGLARLDLPIADSAGSIALVVLAALAVRMVIETVAAHGTRCASPRYNRPACRTRAPFSDWRPTPLVLAIFLFVAISYIGSCWQLYVGGALFILPKVLHLFADRLPNSPRVYAVTPRGIVEIVLMLFIGAVVGAIVLGHFSSGQEAIRDAFVLLSLPGSRAGDARALRQGGRGTGAAVPAPAPGHPARRHRGAPRPRRRSRYDRRKAEARARLELSGFRSYYGRQGRAAVSTLSPSTTLRCN